MHGASPLSTWLVLRICDLPLPLPPTCLSSFYRKPGPEMSKTDQIKKRARERGLVVDWLNWHQMREEWTCVRGCRVGLISNSESRKFRAHNLYICTYFDIFLIVRKKLGIPRNTHASTWLRPWIITIYLRMIDGFAILCQACQLPATHPHSSQETSNLQQSYKSWDRDQAIKKYQCTKARSFFRILTDGTDSIIQLEYWMQINFLADLAP